MQCTIRSRTLKKTLTFSRPGGYHIFVDINGQPGTLGIQICEHGRLSSSSLGSTLGYGGEDQEVFELLCRRWYQDHLRETAGARDGQ